MSQYQPTKKNPGINKFLNDMSGDNREAAITLGFCILPPIGCGEPVEGFRDEISRKDFEITGLCQKCQDNFYRDEE